MVLAVLASAATATPRFEVLPWNANLAPPVYGPGDSTHLRTWAPDTLGASNRDRIDVALLAAPAHIDGRLDDWRLVRWYDLAGQATLFRGPWSGPADFAVHFAVGWTQDGIFFGAELHDDAPAPAAGPYHPVERVTLALASNDPVVQRYWMGGSRRFRVTRDGRAEAWTDLRNHRPEPFDPEEIGVQAAATAHDSTDRPGPTTFELFVPWSALFPMLPGHDGDILLNVILEDEDGEVSKAAAWSTRFAGEKLAPAWAAAQFIGGVREPPWIVAASTRTPEPWCEWVVAATRPRTGSRSSEVSLEVTGMKGLERPQRAPLPAGDRFLLRFGPLATATTVWPSQRQFEAGLQLPGMTQAWSDRLIAPVDSLGLAAAIHAEMSQLHDDEDAGFPARSDVVVRLDRAATELQAIGTWNKRRFHSTGILAARAAARGHIEKRLQEAEVLRDALAGGGDAATRNARIDSMWPHRGRGGLPAGVPFLRGHRSVLDGSVQPYEILVPESAGEHPPLLVALHDVDQDESSLFTASTLVERCSARGWVIVCPYGRGNVGYLTAGERDVLETIDAVRAAVPVDGRRIYLTGLGMGGTGAWLLPLRHPDLFAASAVVAGYGDFDQPGLFEFLGYQPAEEGWYEAHNPLRLLHPGMTTVFRITHGERDAIVSPVHARIMHARLQELGIEHEYELDPAGDHGPRFFDDQLEDNLAFLSRHARVADGTWRSGSFAGVGPPIADVFSRGPFAIVWGTRASSPGAVERPPSGALGMLSDDQATALELAASWRAKYHGAAVVLPDTAVTSEMLRTTNLVLVGDSQTNQLLARWAKPLPVRYEWGLFVIGESGYPLSKYGILFAAANPEFPARTLVVASGMLHRVDAVPRSPFTTGAGYVLVDPVQGAAQIGNFDAKPQEGK
jgi:dienelactone hydrolase